MSVAVKAGDATEAEAAEAEREAVQAQIDKLIFRQEMPPELRNDVQAIMDAEKDQRDAEAAAAVAAAEEESKRLVEAERKEVDGAAAESKEDLQTDVIQEGKDENEPEEVFETQKTAAEVLARRFTRVYCLQAGHMRLF